LEAKADYALGLKANNAPLLGASRIRLRKSRRRRSFAGHGGDGPRPGRATPRERGTGSDRSAHLADSQRGADRAAIMLTMITTCRLNDVDPKAWLAEVLARIADLPASRLHEQLPWEWKLLRQADKPAGQQVA
jgi:hypothetical protein